MRWTKRRKLAAIAIGAAAVLAAGYGAYRAVRWRHRQAEARRVRGYREIIWRHARANAVPTELVEAIILAESGGDPGAVSEKDARGLMQIRPIAERDVLARRGLAPGDLFDPDYNVLIGTTYLRMLLNRFDEDVELALAAYHAGPTRIARLRREHPDLTGRELVRRHAPRSTAAYCRKVLDRP